MKKKHKIIAIVGPSASGKSNLAINLAKELNAEIISADSRLIYKELDIATAKPTLEEKQGIIHHLIDVKEPVEDYTVAEFADDAKKIIESMVSRNKTPIIAGGTGLYSRILLENYDLPRVAPNETLREELEKLPTQELYEALVQLDPEIAEKLHCNNKVKIIRAIEVCRTLGVPMSQAQGIKDAEYDVLWIGLNASNRDFLYDRINQRVDIMVADGLVEEAKNLFGKYPNLSLLKSTIGYQELEPYLSGEISFNESIENLKQNTRRYAKRQLSWFRANKNINWLNIDELAPDQLLNYAKNLVTSFLETKSC